MRRVVLVMLLSKVCYGAFEMSAIDARSSALASAVSAISNGAVSGFLNPAGLAKLEKPE